MFRPTKENLFRWLFAGAFWTVMGLSALILVFLLLESLPILTQDGLGFLTGQVWRKAQVYGALPMLWGTLLSAGLALLLAFPAGLGAAILSSEYMGGTKRLALKSLLELLAGVPGVVYGLLGVTILVLLVRDLFGLLDGNTFLAAGVLLGIMTAPVLATLFDDALQAVPPELRAQAKALGLKKSEVILFVLLPRARRAILGASLLGLSRAMGETIAVMLVVGSVARLPQPLFNLFSSGDTITSRLGREAAEALGQNPHWSALMALALVLYIFVMALSFLGRFLSRSANVEAGS